MHADVVVFGFNRVKPLEDLLNSLKQCRLSDETNVILFIDGPRNKRDEMCIAQVKSEVIQKFDGCFNSFSVNFREKNMGLASSLKSGISEAFRDNEKLIVLEDDLKLSENFLLYMNQSLDYYRENKLIGSISGFSTRVQSNQVESVHFHPRPCSWGWGTWKDRWEKCDWDYKPTTKLDALRMWYKSRKAGQDVFRMYKNQLEGRINSWAIMWTIHHIRSNWLVVYPIQSKVINAGFGDDATHCTGRNPFPTNLDMSNSGNFHLMPEPKIDTKTLKQVNYFHSNFYKILFKLGLK
ncbi:sugar transferase [Enterovibrio baiacu]|uniref:sugar transferase n=1 Tax=Enterovibrio baiacu TaxID=2491023 RepID=UPI00101227ED|nr:sugar transferase [Enterovibrio baiacu]MBE1274995.1 sugar transferase [Enterovibrio baiacu]